MEEEGTKLTHRKNKMSKSQPRAYSGIPTDEYNECRDEKPWQRVLYEITRKGIHLYEPVKSVPSALIIILLGLYLLLGFLTQLIEDDMPSVIQESTIERNDWQTFSEESAQHYLKQILGGEPRVAGTIFHFVKTRDLFNLVNDVASQSRLPVRTDWQYATGDYFLNMSIPYVNYYQNVSNIVALLEGENGFRSDGTLAPSLLVNCHYDSVPFAQGASDNGVFCAVMVEVLSRLARRTTKFKHNVIFLFNGAEENPLQGSHAFLQHPWAKSVTALINLDAGGMNGKPSVFQVTDPRILSAYQAGTPRPSAQGVGEFLFMSGIIPSDTDFRIFRDFGHIQGIDIAFTKWGVVYHTRNDRPELILPGVIQNAGNMLLNLVAQAADLELQEKVPSTPMVYFDYLNLFMVSYSYAVSYALDVLVALFALSSVAYYIWLVGLRWSTVQELLWALAGRACCLIGGLALVAVLVPIMVATTVQLRYLSQPWIVVPMFWVPYVTGTIAVAHAFDAWRTKKSGLNRSIRTLQAMAATRLLLAVVLLVMCCVPPLTTVRYVLAVPLFTMSLASLVSMTVIRYVRLQAWQHLILEFVLSVPSTMFMFVLALRLDAMMLPIMGRSSGNNPDYLVAIINVGIAVITCVTVFVLSLPVAMFMFVLALRLDAMMLPIMGRSSGNNPDYLVAIINVGIAVITCVTVSGVELLFSRKRLWLPLGAVLVGCLVCMLVPFSPYQDGGPATQRHYWLHSDLITYNERKEQISRSSGVFVTKHDPYTTQDVLPALSRANIHINSRSNFGEDCENKVYCGMPVYRVAMGKYVSEGLFLYSGAPRSFERKTDVTLASKACSGQQCTYNFEVAVAPHNVLTLWPRSNISIASWSFDSPVQPSFRLQGRPVYVVMHSVATYSEIFEPFLFTVTFNVPQSFQSGPILDLSDHAHLIYHPEEFTSEYSALVAAAPAYFNVASVMTIRSDYVF